MTARVSNFHAAFPASNRSITLRVSKEANTTQIVKKIYIEGANRNKSNSHDYTSSLHERNSVICACRSSRRRCRVPSRVSKTISWQFHTAVPIESIQPFFFLNIPKPISYLHLPQIEISYSLKHAIILSLQLFLSCCKVRIMSI